ncbi:hypothetical protein QBC34DRAFT_440653 [Podospora aff. communis PSN243]|uniref:Uncharacterized protein n=1 Tax=Podospora aff. communis PSN243 TaxID=3040156 RepID=A0AAV9GGZ5_9PEZI|nr:hypothetical protein QBC34DRAFT_440653 [Podospora aff. communis PSN243]
MVYHNSRRGRDDGFDDYSDGDSYDSRSDASSDEGRPVRNWLGARPVFFLNREDGQQPVYEAWGLRLPADEFKPSVVTTSMGGEQADLANLHLAGLEEFQRKHRGGWASRVFRGKPKTYEQHIDNKCKKLPPVIQEAIHDLLEERGRHSSTVFRSRTWTVAVISARERYRFAQTKLAEARRHKLRFWKNSGSDELLDYFVVIRGSETDVCTDPRGFYQFAEFTNPWLDVDTDEGLRMDRERNRIFDERRKKIGAERRTRSPSLPSYRDWRERSPSPEPMPSRTRYRSPPSYRSRRSRSPISEPDTEVEAQRYIRMTRAAGNAPPSAPVAPAFNRYAPPPQTRSPSPYTSRSFSRPRVPYEEPNRWRAAPPPEQPAYPRPTVSVYAPQHFGFPEPDVDSDTESQYGHGTPECIACQVTPECEHYSRSRVCDRPINWRDDRATHPPCFICMAAGAPLSNPFDFGPPPPPPPHPIVTCPAYASSPPPSYPPTERPGSRNGDLDGDVNDSTDIESDGGDLDDGETTAVADSPQRSKDGE